LGNLLRASGVTIGYTFLLGGRRNEGRLMLGDPNECRAHAAYCVEVAAETTSTIIKTTFWDLARQWTKLATDIEMAVALRAELEPDPKFDGSGAPLRSL
jgi:hypothetical protein